MLLLLMMTDHYQGNVFMEYTALRTQKGKNALTDVKSIRLRQQNVTLSLFGVRASGKKGTQKRFTNRYQIWVPSLFNADQTRVNCHGALPKCPASFKGEWANDAEIWGAEVAESQMEVSGLLKESFWKLPASLDSTKDIMFFASCLWHSR